MDQPSTQETEDLEAEQPSDNMNVEVTGAKNHGALSWSTG